MLHKGRLPLTAAETDAVDALIVRYPCKPVSLTRRDPGEQGPVLVHVGAATYTVDAHGRARKQRSS